VGVEGRKLGFLNTHNDRRSEREGIADKGALIVVSQAAGVPGDERELFEAVPIHQTSGAPRGDKQRWRHGEQRHADSLTVGKKTN
jgi:hypothetical protein